MHRAPDVQFTVEIGAQGAPVLDVKILGRSFPVELETGLAADLGQQLLSASAAAEDEPGSGAPRIGRVMTLASQALKDSQLTEVGAVAVMINTAVGSLRNQDDRAAAVNMLRALADRIAGGSPKAMQAHAGQRFERERITLDHATFEDCSFVDCELVYTGQSGCGFTRCTFEGDTRLVLDGPAARAASLLTSMSQARLLPLVRSAAPGLVEALAGTVRT